MTHKAGFVNILGRPNAGKSTLMNAWIGEKLSIITPKAQTTRKRIMGILSGEDFQIVFSDTPGILKPAYKLHEYMMQYVNIALKDADILVFVSTPSDTQEDQEWVLSNCSQFEIPFLVLINKMDLAGQSQIENALLSWSEKLPKAVVKPISALHGFNVSESLDWIQSHLPESPAYFPKDELSDKTMRFFVSEWIREQIFLLYDKEIPYSCEVLTESYEESRDLVRIRCLIMVSRETQKGIIIGHKGEKLKQVGTNARKNIEAFIKKKVFLEIYVKVDPSWRENEKRLRQYGYS